MKLRLAVIALVIGTLAPVTAVAVSGSNAYGAGSQVSCAKVAGNLGTMTLTKCSGPSSFIAKAGKGLGITYITCEIVCGGYPIVATIYWGSGTSNGGGATSSVGFGLAGTGPGKGTPCGTKEKTWTEVGTVLSGTLAASVLVGDTVSATICANPTTQAILKVVKRTTFEI